MRNSHFIGLCFALLLSSLSCKDEPTEPPKPPPPGKRDYTWTIDTLSYPGSFQILMKDIWGSSPKDVYVVGHNDQGFGKMYRYDGHTWKPVKLVTAEGGLINGPIDLTAVYGFSATNIWAVGERTGWDPVLSKYSDTSLIIHYDGQKWREVPHSPRSRYLTTIWGASPTDIWAGGGLNGALYHYNGSTWTKMPFDTTLGFASLFGFSSSDIYALCARKVDWVSPQDSSQHLFYQYDGSRWHARDSFIVYPWHGGDKFGRTRLWGTAGKLYSVGGAVFTNERRTGWSKVLNTYLPFYGIYGSSPLNIFVVGYGRQVYHFNGTDWSQFPGFTFTTDQWCSKAWCNDAEVFILAGNGFKSFIYNGK